MGEYVGYLWKMGNVGNKIAVNPWIKGGKGMQRKTKYGVTDGAVNSWIKGGKGTRRKTKYGVRDCDRSVIVGQKNYDRFWPIGQNFVWQILTDRSQYLFWPTFGQNNRYSVKICLHFWQLQRRSKFSKFGRNVGQKIVTDLFRSKFSVRICELFCSELKGKKW